MSSTALTMRDSLRSGSLEEKKEALDLIISNVSGRVTDNFRKKDRDHYIGSVFDFLKESVLKPAVVYGGVAMIALGTIAAASHGVANPDHFAQALNHFGQAVPDKLKDDVVSAFYIGSISGVIGKAVSEIPDVMRQLLFKEKVIEGKIEPNDVAVELMNYLDEAGVDPNQVYRTTFEAASTNPDINDPRFKSKELAIHAILKQTPLKASDKKFNKMIDQSIEINSQYDLGHTP